MSKEWIRNIIIFLSSLIVIIAIYTNSFKDIEQVCRKKKNTEYFLLNYVTKQNLKEIVKKHNKVYQLKDKELDFRNCIIFEDIIVITDEVKNNTKRLGDLWSYDTALRIGFHLKIYPTDVYIQAGVKKGYFKLLNKKPRKRKVPRIKFPMLDELEVYEIENFLCIWGSDKLIKKPC